MFHVYLVSTNTFIDIKAEEFREFFDDWDTLVESESEPLLTASEKESGFRALIDLKTHEPFLNEATLCRSVDSFLTYIAQILADFFLTQPEALSRSKKSVSYEFLLSFPDRPSLVAAIAEREVQAFSYLGLGGLREEIKKQYGFELFVDPSLFAEVQRLVEYRNLLVHNRGIINNTFKSRLPEETGDVGERLRISYSDVHRYRRALTYAVLEIDPRAAKKWHLATTPHRLGQALNNFLGME